MDQPYRLFGEFAARYDLHTPPEDYLTHRQFALEELARRGSGLRVLDVGCGTGAFLECARQAGHDAQGIDASSEMVAVAEERLGPGIARVGRMQELDEQERYDAIVSLALPFNYCSGVAEARAVLIAFHRALRPGGLVLLQVAHAAHAPPRLIEDWEPGPGGERDIQFLCRFTAVGDHGDPVLHCQYVYSCRSLAELFFEEHRLHVADANRVAELVSEAGFGDVEVYDNARREPLTRALDPFVLGTRQAAWAT